MKVSIGRTVIVRGLISNGTDQHPAIVNRAWADHDTCDLPVMANLTVFPDMGVVQCHGSIMVYDTREHAEAAQARHRAEWESQANPQTSYRPLVVAHWPERV